MQPSSKATNGTVEIDIDCNCLSELYWLYFQGLKVPPPPLSLSLSLFLYLYSFREEGWSYSAQNRGNRLLNKLNCKRVPENSVKNQGYRLKKIHAMIAFLRIRYKIGATKGLTSKILSHGWIPKNPVQDCVHQGFGFKNIEPWLNS